METETPSPASTQVQCDHLGMPGVGHRDHPASVGHKLRMTQWTERDRELVNSSLHPPHSGPLHLLWAVHGQSLDGPLYKPAGSSPGHPGGRLADMALPCDTSYTQHICRVTMGWQSEYNMCNAKVLRWLSDWVSIVRAGLCRAPHGQGQMGTTQQRGGRGAFGT